MSISDEAVEAGLAAWADRKAVWPRDVVRHILAAAAPYMLAEAWDEGYAAGVWEESPGWTKNPHRSGNE